LILKNQIVMCVSIFIYLIFVLFFMIYEIDFEEKKYNILINKKRIKNKKIYEKYNKSAI